MNVEMCVATPQQLNLWLLVGLRAQQYLTTRGKALDRVHNSIASICFYFVTLTFDLILIGG